MLLGTGESGTDYWTLTRLSGKGIFEALWLMSKRCCEPIGLRLTYGNKCQERLAAARTALLTK
jgi:hypothetical protein